MKIHTSTKNRDKQTFHVTDLLVFNYQLSSKDIWNLYYQIMFLHPWETWACVLKRRYSLYWVLLPLLNVPLNFVSMTSTQTRFPVIFTYCPYIIFEKCPRFPPLLLSRCFFYYIFRSGFFPTILRTYPAHLCHLKVIKI